MKRLLREAGLIDTDGAWSGGAAHLWFMGDFFDRGPDSIGALSLAMQLQREAAAAGGSLEALLGNHEVMVLAAARFGASAHGSSFVKVWRRNGGCPADLKRLTREQLDWMQERPAMALVGDHLLLHADALFYTHYGDTIEAVNKAIGAALASNDPKAFYQLLEFFSERMAFATPRPREGIERARHLLDLFGGRAIAHGHTPIVYMEPERPLETIVEPLSYANGLCLNLDGGIYLGGPGFVYELPD